MKSKYIQVLDKSPILLVVPGRYRYLYIRFV